LTANGWLLESLACSERTLEIKWQHQPGADYLTLPEHAVLNPNPKSATSKFPLPALAVQRQGQEFPGIWSKDMAARALYQLCSLIGARVGDLKFGVPDKRTIDKVEITEPWVRAEFEFTDAPFLLLGDPDFARMLSNIPGLTLEAIHYNGGFVYKGHIYAHR
jgi:hypothetical protein